MEAIGMIILALIIWGFISNSKAESKRKENERINEQIRKGELVRLSNGKVKSPKSLTQYEKSLLPDYQYLYEHGAKYGLNFHGTNIINIEILNVMDVQQLKEAAKKVRSKRTQEENEKRRIEEEKRRIEREKRRIEEEQRRIEWKQQEQERIRDERLNKWRQLSSKILFELEKGNSDSKKMGIYVIHCIPDNRLYIGSSKNMLTRKSQHLSALRNKKHHSFKLQEAFDEFGEHSFRFYALRLITKNDLFMLSHYKNEKDIERALKRQIKSEEQSFLDSYTPTFNIENDARGRRHWEENYKYWGGYGRY